MAILDRRRRTVRLLLPAVQLKLPMYLLGISALFLGTMAWVAHSGLVRPVGMIYAQLPPALADTMTLVLRDFGILAGAATVAYVLLVVGLSVVYVKWLVGPAVAFRRHLASLKGGDYRSRVKLRDNDPFRDLALDLNQLAELLEATAKPEAAPRSW